MTSAPAAGAPDEGDRRTARLSVGTGDSNMMLTMIAAAIDALTAATVNTELTMERRTRGGALTWGRSLPDATPRRSAASRPWFPALPACRARHWLGIEAVEGFADCHVVG